MARRVLVVDDEKLIVKGIRFSLEQDGMEVTCAYDGEEALTFAKEQQFDMVQYSTPNASMYASFAAKSAKIPVRLYCQWGMVYVTMSGIKRKV